MNATGIIAEDPAIDLPIGAELRFSPVQVISAQEEPAAVLADMKQLHGLVLLIQFKGAHGETIEGSAVMIGPGVALCATHVIEPHIDTLDGGLTAVLCTGVAPHGLQMWRLKHVMFVPQSDLAILGLTYASQLPPENHFYLASVTTRLPPVGEKLLIYGFRSTEQVQVREDGHREWKARLYSCVGAVSARYPERRDDALMPWPALEVGCPAWGGMSGGPAFDSRGNLVGLLSSSIESDDNDGPCFVSLLWPSLVEEFSGGWPETMFPEKYSLLNADARMFPIDDRSAVTFENDDQGKRIFYKAWE